MAEQIDVTKIMEGIRAEIKASGADQIPLSFADKIDCKGPSGLDSAVEYISYNYEVQPCQLLVGNPIKVFVKRCIRKLAGFFFLPIVQQQNTLNQYYAYLAETIVDQRNEIESLKEEIKRLEDFNASSKEAR